MSLLTGMMSVLGLGPTNFDVSCTLQTSTFYPGNVVRGTIHVVCKAVERVRAVRLSVSGIESYSFTYKSGDHERRESGSVNVMNYEFTLAGFPKNQQGEFLMPIGSFFYPFEVVLPMNIPPSYQYRYASDYASTTYQVHVVVDIPWARDTEGVFPFTVLNCCPLSQWQMDTPKDVLELKEVHGCVCCCCKFCHKGNLSFAGKLHRTLIVMGCDVAHIILNISNNSVEPVQALDLKLIQRNTTNSGGRTDVNTRTVMKYKQLTNIPPNSASNVVQLSFPIPRGILPSFHGIHVKSQYFLRVEFDVPNAFDPFVEFPITIVQGVDPMNVVPPINFEFPMCTAVVTPLMYQYAPPATKRPDMEFAPIGGAPTNVSQLPIYQPPPVTANVPMPDQSWSRIPPNTFTEEIPFQACPPPPVGVSTPLIPQPQMGMGMGVQPPPPPPRNPADAKDPISQSWL
eukprot:PhF_6_TR8678/c0_g2_i1/m.13586